ncbi:MAG TPA: alpha/beta fold hydrolase [Candidatus Bathyarchaeia archaeon]|nr:alpha/beta fold hydrolase [Candidatus Bathyarchaeia archaeon]
MGIIFVTGATGFIGKEMVRELVKNGHTVLALIRSQVKWQNMLHNFSEHEKKSCIGIVGDLRREDLGLSSKSYDQVMSADVIIHAGVPMNILLDEETAMDVILHGSRRLLKVAKEIHRRKKLETFIHLVGYMSPITDQNAKTTEDVFTMSDFMRGVGGYERYKFLADLLVRQETAREGIPLTVINPSVVIGPRDTGSTQQLEGFGMLVDTLRRGKMPVLLGGKEWWLPLIPLDDLAKVIAGLAQPQESQVQTHFALFDRNVIPPLPQLIQLIAKELRIPAPTIPVSVPIIKKMLRWGGSRVMGLPANSMDFLTTKEFPVQSFQASIDRLGIEQYDVTRYLPRVIADLDYRLSNEHSSNPHNYTRELTGNLASFKKEGTGKPWVFLHGLFSDMDDILPLASQLKEEPVILFDLPGFGRSPYHHHVHVLEGYVDTVLEAIKELPSTVYLVGHSLGAYIASKVAERVPNKVEKLYLMQPPLHRPRYPAAINLAGKVQSLLTTSLKYRGTPKQLSKMFLNQGVFGSVEEIPENYLQKVAGTLRSPRIRQSHAELLSFLMRDFTGMSFLRSLKVPIRVIWGTRDQAYQLSEEMETELMQAKIELVKLDLAHNFPITHPQIAADLLRDRFLK